MMRLKITYLSWGTVIIAEPADHESNHWEDATDIQYYNFAPVYRGGEDWRNKVRRIDIVSAVLYNMVLHFRTA